MSDTGPVRVLLIDDQESFRSAARMVLAMSEGFELIGEAETGEGGLELVREVEPDLVLMDIGLPGMSGLEATRRMVAGGIQARVIALSTYEATDFEEKALAAGAVAFVSKSDFGPEVLRRTWDGVGR